MKKILKELNFKNKISLKMPNYRYKNIKNKILRKLYNKNYLNLIKS